MAMSAPRLQNFLDALTHKLIHQREADLPPTGVPMPWPGATAPLGYVICDGSAVPANCPQLTALYGANLPNLKGRVIVGYDAAQAEFNTLLAVSGTKTVALAAADLPTHTHDLANHFHGVSGNTTGRSAFHRHGNAVATSTSGHLHDNTAEQMAGRPTGAIGFTGANAMTTDDTDHVHGVSINSGVPSSNTSGDGGFANNGHSNLQPYTVFNYIVRKG